MSSTEFEAWKQARTEAVTSPTGNLALIAYQPVTGKEPVEEIDGLIVEPSEGAEGVFITPEEGVEAFVDGVKIEGRTFVERLKADGTPHVKCDRFTFDVFSLDGTDYELRIYDPESDGLQSFEKIDVYPENPEMIISGKFREYDHTEQVSWGFTRESDDGHKKKVPGVIDVTIAGKDYSLICFLDGPRIVLVYGDGTSGVESYGAGKFLLVPAPDADGNVTLDFNRSFIPPCGFSMFYSCPIPPEANKVKAPIRAGEKIVVFKDGAGH